MAHISNILQNLNKKSFTRYIGIALIIAFILVTAMFVILHINSEQRQSHVFGGANAGGDSMGMGEDGEYSGTHNGSLNQSEQDPADFDDPANQGDLTDPEDFIDPDDPYNSGDPQDDPDQSQTGDPVQIAYLTFDDGPVRSITTGILDILLEEDIRATFFVLPYQGVDDLYQRIIDEGHEIGNHSYSHVYERLYDGNVSRFRDDILKARNFIFDNFDYTTTSFRFPGGQLRAGNGLSARLEVIRDFGYRHFHWHVDPDDWRTGRTAEEVRASVREQANTHVRNGREHVIILLHDRYQRTLEALPGIIKDLRDMGFEFDTVRNMP